MSPLFASHAIEHYFIYAGAIAGITVVSIGLTSVVLRKFSRVEQPTPAWAKCIHCEHMQDCVPYWDEFTLPGPPRLKSQ